jgi:spermidine synthase
VSQRPSSIFLVLFTISGACGLIYEVAWTRLFTVVIGNTVYSVSAILTVFMAGLALGSRAAGELIDEKPIRLARMYAVLELGIGIYNLLLPYFLKAVDPIFGAVYAGAYESAGILIGVRVAIAFALLILPAALMGATLPVLIRLYAGSVEDAGRETGRVYAVNTCGAALGAAAAGSLIVPYLGVMFALRLAAGLNLLISGVAAVYDRRQSLASDIAGAHRAPLQQRPYIVLVAMFLSGLAALADEVAWTRVLALVVGPTTYAFTLMLCAMIAGLGLGAALAARWLKRGAIQAGAFAWVQIAIGLASVALIPAFGQLPLWIARLVTRYVESFTAIQVFEFLIFFGLLLVPTLLFGMTFPIAASLYAKSDSFLGSEVSAVYAFNTLGGIAGSLLAGFLLIPYVGSQYTLTIAAAVNLTVAAVYHRRRSLLFGVLLAFAASFFIPRWNPEIMSSGAYKYAPAYARNADLETILASGDLLYFKEGATTTVSVRKFRGTTSLAVDGKVDATDAGDMTTQKMLAHLPLLLSKDAKNVAIIGLGSGVTAAAALKHPIEKLDVIEISPEVVDASRFFSRVNAGALTDPRVELILGDGRNHLRYTQRQYDVIISEPSNPWMAGMASLFTREFFEEARSHLAPGGIHCQWFHSYNMSLDDVKTVLATFRSQFPHAALWTLNEYDLFLLGSTSPMTIDPSLVERNFQRVAGDLAEIKVQDTYTILSSALLSDAELDRFAGGAALNTDDLPVLEFRAPRSIHADTTDSNVAALSAARSTEAPATGTAENHRHKAEMLAAAEAFQGATKEFEAAIALDPGNADLRLAAANFYSDRGNYKRAIELLEMVLASNPKNVKALEKIADALENDNNPRLAVITDRLLATAPDNPNGLYHLATFRFYQGRVDEAIQLTKRVLESDPASVRARRLLAVSYDKTFQPDLAEAEFRRAIEQAPDDYVSYNNYGVFLLGRNRAAEARDQFRRAIALNPENIEGLVGIGESLRQAGKRTEAQQWYGKALRLDPNQPIARQYVK